MSHEAPTAAGDRAHLRPVLGGYRAIGLALPPLRLRPAERPVWVDLPLTGAQARRWRARAASQRLPVDAWLGLLLEYQLVRKQLVRIAGPDLVSRVLETAGDVSLEARLAPSPELQRWVRLLGGADVSPPDDLPSVVLGERLLAQLPPDRRSAAISAAAGSGLEAEAIMLDRAAATYGQTIEAWAYLAALGAA